MTGRSFYKHMLIFLTIVSPGLKMNAQQVPLGQEKLVQLLDQELSGESSKRNLEYISRPHRVRGSKDYNKAIDFIADKLAEYKLEGIETIKIPSDGVTMYGTQKSRPAQYRFR